MRIQNQVMFTSNVGETMKKVLEEHSSGKIVILTDRNTLFQCYPLVKTELPEHETIVIEPGEEHKNIGTCMEVWRRLTAFQVDRKGILVVIGGGVAGDLGGFCAATYKRGIDFILIPTTLLAQVDASVGGKLGIDFENFKNHIGVFKEPLATLIDSRFLKTLSNSELRSGFAEIIKHCLLSDKKMWDEVRSQPLTSQNWPKLVKHSVEFKRKIVAEDPQESGLRKILNFGHTIGHAIESFSLQTSRRLLHGEAIAIGMICEAWIGFNKKTLTGEELEQITVYIKQVFGKSELPKDKDLLIKLIYQDKKSMGNKILMAIPEGIGRYQWDIEASPAEIEEAIRYYDSV